MELTNDKKPIFAERHRIAREHFRLSTKEMAKVAGISPSAVNFTENGKTKTPAFEYTRYLVGKGINFDFLIGESDKMLANTVSEKSNENSEVVESLQDEIKDLKRTVSILLGELERLKKELSQSRTIPMTDHGYHQLPEVQVGKRETVNNDWGLWKNGNLLKKAI